MESETDFKGNKIIEKTPPLSLDDGNTAVLTFGRFQPPHLGHKKMIDYVYRLSKKSITPDEIDKTGSNDSSKIIVAKKYIMEYKETVERSDPSPEKINILDALESAGGFEGDSYVFVSRNRSKEEDKKKIYNPGPRSRSKAMTFEGVMELLNKPSSEMDDKEQKLKDKIKKALSNPLDPQDKVKLMKLQYYDYPDLNIVDPTYFFDEDPDLTPNKNIQLNDIVPKLLKNNYNRIVIVVGDDRKDAFDFVAKSAQSSIPPNMKTAELVIVAIGRDLGGEGFISGLSATKVRLAALNIDVDNYDDPKNDGEKEKLISYLLPQGAPENVEVQLKALLPDLVRKIHEGYKPSAAMKGGRYKNTRRKTRKNTQKNNKKTFMDSMSYRKKRKTYRLNKMSKNKNK
jgi:hypothetical protein